VTGLHPPGVFIVQEKENCLSTLAAPSLRCKRLPDNHFHILIGNCSDGYYAVEPSRMTIETSQSLPDMFGLCEPHR